MVRLFCRVSLIYLSTRGGKTAYVVLRDTRKSEHGTHVAGVAGVVELPQYGCDGARAARRYPVFQTLRHAGIRVGRERAHCLDVFVVQLFCARRGAPSGYDNGVVRTVIQGRHVPQRGRERKRVSQPNVALALRGSRLPRLQACVLKVSVFVEKCSFTRVEFSNRKRLAARAAQVRNVAMHSARVL